MARAAEREDSTGGAEIVLGRARVPLIQRQLVERREKPQVMLLDAMDQRAALATDGAVARSDVVQVEVDLESYPATVAGAAV
jgi:hypothetical protein